MNGSLPACLLVKAECKRFIEDLERQRTDKFPYYYDESSEDFSCDFFTHLKHSKGEWAGKPFELSLWQKFIVGNIFAWKEVGTGYRRFRSVYIEVPRKNGKSTLCAGIGILLAFFDGEPGAEVYAAATKRDQAKIVWGEAKRMVRATAGLHFIKQLSLNLVDEDTNSKFEPLGADSKNLDGLNTHAAIVDELHAHRNSEVWDVIRSSTGSRRQPLTFVITTAGYDRKSICYAQHEFSDQVSRRVLQDDSHFGYIATIDKEDDWKDEAVWAKANPNLGVSKHIEVIRKDFTDAKAKPIEQNAFMRYHLCVWTEQADRLVDMDLWNECGGGPEDVPESDLVGRPCYLGIDLASKTDLAAVVAVFALPNGKYAVRCWFFVPDDNAHARSKKDGVPYSLWREQGNIIFTPGNIIDYDFIKRVLREEIARKYKVQEIGYDPWNATQFAVELEALGFKMTEVRQGTITMSEPLKYILGLIMARRLVHYNHPVLRWNAANMVARMDANGNIAPDKGKATEKIDGFVAMVIAMQRAIVTEKPQASVYSTRGVRVIQ